jgi:3',5'-cyclic AMP phosphodiesterase CpdA
MPLILHLSDLHLATPDQERDVGDYKLELIPANQRQRRSRYIRNTLVALATYLDARHETLDAVVVSGDVTYKGAPDGFGALPDVLSNLGDHIPPDNRIVVVPGNHDIVVNTPPSSPERYAPFLDGIRTAGYVTPFLDGIDVSGAGFLGPLLVRDTYLVAAVNSADYCASRNPLTSELEAELDRLTNKRQISSALAKHIEKLRTLAADAVRINPDQLEALSSAMDRADPEATRVRIVALHHQLAPVSTDEEVKPFDSLINLGEMRQFLSDNRIELVLHGHKHLSRVVEDTFTPYGERADDPRVATRAVVVSCGSIDSQPGRGRDIAKLIALSADLPRLRRVRVTAIKSVNVGGRLPTNSDGSLRVDPDETSLHLLNRGRTTADTLVLTGATAAEVHEQIEEIALGAKTPTGPLICIVETGASARTPPPTYPQNTSLPPDLATWFRETVDWWQESRSDRARPFTHGKFIREWQSAEPPRDQLLSVIAALQSHEKTSRGVVTLLDPPRSLENKENTFPAFCLIQFVRREGLVDAIALFRKQEMRYWWPINAAEVARLLDEVVHGLTERGSEVQVGRLTTIANMPVFSDNLPKVAVPRIDQIALRDDGNAQLIQYAIAIALSGATDRVAHLTTLRALFMELRLPDHMPTDGPPLSRHGLTRLRDAIGALQVSLPAATDVQQIVRLLDRVIDKSASMPAEESELQRYRTLQGEMNAALEDLDTSLARTIELITGATRPA